MKRMDASRRGFLKSASTGLGAASLAGAHQVLGAPSDRVRGGLARQVWLASITLGDFQPETYQQNIELILGRMEQVVPYKPDIVCLPEIAPFMKLRKRPPLAQVAEQGLGPITRRFAEFARTNRCYVILPIYTKESGRYYNAAVLIDREGEHAGEYRKIYPTVGEMENGITPGPTDPPVFETDFAVIGIQICFDLQFFNGFKRLGEKGAEIVFWPSAYCGGRALNAVAWMNRFIVVASTRFDPAKICDIDGGDIADTAYRSRHWICEPINLEKKLIKKWPHSAKFEDIIKKYGRAIRIKVHEEEVWAGRKPVVRCARR